MDIKSRPPAEINEEIAYLINEGGNTYVPAFRYFNEVMAKTNSKTVLQVMLRPNVDGMDVIPGGLQQSAYVRELLISDAYKQRYEDPQASLERDVKLRSAQSELGRVGVRQFIITEQALKAPVFLDGKLGIMDETLAYLLEIIAAESENEEAARTRIRVMLSEESSAHPEMLLLYPNGLDDPELHVFGYVHREFNEVSIGAHSAPDFQNAWKKAWDKALPLGESQQIITHAKERLTWRKGSRK